jgi:hypothetical protein
MQNLSILILRSLCMPFIGCTQSKHLSNYIEGKYELKDSLRIIATSLELYANGKYLYKTGGDIITQQSYGNWSIKGDTITLKASIDQGGIPISCKRIRNRLHERIRFI